MSDPAKTDRLEVLPASPGSEPEEAPARRVQALPLQINLSGPDLPEVTTGQGRPALKFNGLQPVGSVMKLMPVSTEMTAGEAAEAAKNRCARCRHFRNEDWVKLKKIWNAAPPGSDRKLGYTKMVIRFARSVLDRDPVPGDLDRASREMNMWGICVAHSEDVGDTVVVHPEACCPPERPNYYQDRDTPSKREASGVYDKILKAAQGKF